MHPRHELFSNLSLEDVSASLSACVLAEKDEYTDDEAYRFRSCRQLVNQGKTYDEVAKLFRQNDIALTTEPQPTEPDPQIKTKNPSNANKPTANPLNISELLSLASEQVGNRISLIEAGRILEACGLPDQDEYTDSQCDRFLEACDLYKKQAKTTEQIAAHFVDSALGSDSNNLKQAALRFAEKIDETASAAKSGFNRLVDLATEKEAADISQRVNESFLRKAQSKLEEGRTNLEIFYAEVEERMKDQIAGKNQAHSLEATWGWAANSLPPSSPKQMSLPEGSDDGMNGE